MSLIKTAIVGCGGIAQVHEKCLLNLSNVVLVACADNKIERAEQLAHHYETIKNKKCHSYASLEEMLKQERIDVLHICTPHSLHTPMAQLAAKQGISVFTEKPPVISWQQWREFCKLQEYPIRVGICFQNRYNANVQYIKNLLSSGKTGKILGARAFVTWSRDEHYYKDSGWRGTLDMEGGGVLINQAIHTLDLMVELLGKPESVEAHQCNHHLKGCIEVEDTMEAYLKYPDQKAAVFYATSAYSNNAPVFLELHCENMTLQMIGQQLNIVYANGEVQQVVFEKQDTAMGKDYWGNGHFACMSDFYEHYEKKSAPMIGIPEVTATVETMLNIYDASRQDQ